MYTRGTRWQREKFEKILINPRNFQKAWERRKRVKNATQGNNVFVSELRRTNGCIVSASSQHHTSLSLAFNSKVTLTFSIRITFLSFSSSFRSSLTRSLCFHKIFWLSERFHSDYSGDALLERRSGSKRFREISVSYGSYKSSSSSLTEDDDDDDDDGDSSEKDIKSGSVSSSAVTRYDQMKLKVDSTFLCAFSSILILCLFRFVMCLCLEAQRKQTNMRDLKIHLTDSSNENHSVFFILIDSSLEFVSLRYVFVFVSRAKAK